MTGAELIANFGQTANRGKLLTDISGGVLDIVNQSRYNKALQQWQGLTQQFRETGDPKLWAQIVETAPDEGVLKRFTSAQEGMEKYQRQQFVKNNSEIYSAILSGNNDIAINKLKTLADSYENEGDAKEAEMYRDFIKDIEEGNAKDVASFLAGVSLSSEEGREAFNAAWDMQKSRVDRLMTEADVIKTMQEVGVTDPEEKKRLGKALEGMPFEYGKELSELISVVGTEEYGKMTPSQKSSLIENISKTYTKDIAPFISADQTKSKMDASLAENTSQGDVGALFLFMKMLDEGSVVRESEFKTASNMGSLLDSMRNTMDKWSTGQRLQKGQKENLNKLTEAFYRIAEEKRKPFDERVKRKADYYKFSPDLVFLYDEATANTPEEEPKGTGDVEVPIIDVDPTVKKEAEEASKGSKPVKINLN